MVGINTNLPNKLVHEALNNKAIKPFADYPHITPEFTYTKGTRFDFKVENDNNTAMMIEVKNVHLMRPNGPNPGMAEFPDSVTARGAKHLNILAEIARGGEKAAMLMLSSAATLHLSPLQKISIRFMQKHSKMLAMQGLRSMHGNAISD